MLRKKRIARRFMHWYGFFTSIRSQEVEDEVPRGLKSLARDIEINDNIKYYIEYLRE